MKRLKFEVWSLKVLLLIGLLTAILNPQTAHTAVTSEWTMAEIDAGVHQANGAKALALSNSSRIQRVEVQTNLWNADYWTLAVFPDSQMDSDSEYTEVLRPGISTNLANMTQWLLDNAETENVQMIMHVGDFNNIQPGDSETVIRDSWEISQAAFTPLFNSGIPFLATLGNHDYNDGTGSTNKTTYFHEYFPASLYNTKDWFGGSEAGMIENSYFERQIAGREYIFLSIENKPDQTSLDWAEGVIQAHPGHNIIILNHDYLLGYRHPAPYGGYTEYGRKIYDQLVVPYKQVMNVFCGHVGALDVGDGQTNGISRIQIDDRGENGFVNGLVQNYQQVGPYGSGVEPEANILMVRVYPNSGTATLLVRRTIQNDYSARPNDTIQFQFDAPKTSEKPVAKNANDLLISGDGLYGYWDMSTYNNSKDLVVPDLSGNGRDMIANVNGFNSLGYYALSSTNTYLSAGSDDGANVFNSFSVMVDFVPTTRTNNTTAPLIGNGTSEFSAANDGFRVYARTVLTSARYYNGTPYLRVEGLAGGYQSMPLNTAYNYYSYDDQEDEYLNNRYTYVCTYDGSAAYFYINGECVYTNAYVTGGMSSSDSADIYIGTYPGSDDAGSANVYKAAVFTRALSADEAKILSRGGSIAGLKPAVVEPFDTSTLNASRYADPAESQWGEVLNIVTIGNQMSYGTALFTDLDDWTDFLPLELIDTDNKRMDKTLMLNEPEGTIRRAYVRQYITPSFVTTGPDTFMAWALANTNTYTLVTRYQSGSGVAGVDIEDYQNGGSYWAAITGAYVDLLSEIAAPSDTTVDALPSSAQAEVSLGTSGAVDVFVLHIAENGYLSGSYYLHLKKLISDLRTYYNSPSAKIVLIGINGYSYSLGLTQPMESDRASRRLAAEDSSVAYVDGLYFQTRWHYNAESSEMYRPLGVKECGLAIANAINDLFAQPEDSAGERITARHIISDKIKAKTITAKTIGLDYADIEKGLVLTGPGDTGGDAGSNGETWEHYNYRGAFRYSDTNRPNQVILTDVSYIYRYPLGTTDGLLKVAGYLRPNINTSSGAFKLLDMDYADDSSASYHVEIRGMGLPNSNQGATHASFGRNHTTFYTDYTSGVNQAPGTQKQLIVTFSSAITANAGDIVEAGGECFMVCDASITGSTTMNVRDIWTEGQYATSYLLCSTNTPLVVDGVTNAANRVVSLNIGSIYASGEAWLLDNVFFASSDGIYFCPRSGPGAMYEFQATGNIGTAQTTIEGMPPDFPVPGE